MRHFTLEPLYATGRPEVPRFVSLSRIAAADWYPAPGNHESSTKSLDAPIGSWAIRRHVAEKNGLCVDVALLDSGWIVGYTEAIQADSLSLTR